jgi:hypothetical protein
MTDESGPCFQVTGTWNDNVVKIRRCVYCVYSGTFIFRVKKRRYAWCGTTLTNLFNPRCDCTGIERFLTASI